MNSKFVLKSFLGWETPPGNGSPLGGRSLTGSAVPLLGETPRSSCFTARVAALTAYRTFRKIQNEYSVSVSLIWNGMSLAEYKLDYVVAIRSNHGVWVPAGQSVRANKWCKFERTFSNQKSEIRYIREIIYGKKRAITYWEINTDPETMPENSTSFVMTNLQGNLKKTLGDLYGLRTLNFY